MSRRPIGYFVHHQGRGHAERCAALAAALPADRPLSVFCANPDVLPPLGDGVEIVRTPSLFEPSGEEARGMDHVPVPETLHCAPLGWPGIRRATARIVAWFERADPALFVCDVSAELAQLARLCSVPHVAVLQHGVRDDPGHRAAWVGAVGLLAPFDRSLAQPDWPEALLAKTCFAGGLGVRTTLPERDAARARLGLEPDETVYLVLSGAGGEGVASAALGVGARTFPETSWHTIGPVRRTWHATEPANLVHHGWVENALDHLVAADLVIGSAGNTVCQQVLAAGKPWIAVPEWCYFDEQLCKARALATAGLARAEPHLPSHAGGWRRAVGAALADHDARAQRAAVRDDADRHAADWLDGLCDALWDEAPRARGERRCARAAPTREEAARTGRASPPLAAVRPTPVSRASADGGGTAPASASVSASTSTSTSAAASVSASASASASAHRAYRSRADARAPLSVLTIARGREAHLANLVRGLERQERLPDELVVGVMQDEPYEGLPATRFPVRQIPVAGKALPLAAARNAVARHARSELLAFLDVDCIPAPAFVADYAAALGVRAGLLMGEVLYLPEGAVRDDWTVEALERAGVRHDARAGPPSAAFEPCDDYRCFWSLNFAMRRADFDAAGGFDEGYTGYGGEDTDFGKTLATRGIPIGWIRGAKGYHQFHAQRMPPVHHLASVVENAERFADKWGYRTMDHWLHCFALMGLIEDTAEGLRIVSERPDDDSTFALPVDGRPYASTREAMELLEARAETRYRAAHGVAPPDGWLDRRRFVHRTGARREPAGARA